MAPKLRDDHYKMFDLVIAGEKPFLLGHQHGA
jgi:hypothetical protein